MTKPMCSHPIAPGESYLVSLQSGGCVATISVIDCDPLMQDYTVAVAGDRPWFNGTTVVHLQHDTEKSVGPLTLKVITDGDALRLLVEGADTIKRADDGVLAETAADTFPVLGTALVQAAAHIKPPEDLLQTAVWQPVRRKDDP